MNTDAKCKTFSLPKGAHVVKARGKTYYYLWRGGPRFFPDQTTKLTTSRRHGAAERLLKRTAKRARDRGIVFDLDLAWVARELEKFQDRCALTGLPFDYGGARVGHRANADAPSIDRADNRIGYTRANSRIVLASVNIALNEWGFDAFLRIAEAMVLKQGSISRQRKAEKRILGNKPETTNEQSE